MVLSATGAFATGNMRMAATTDANGEYFFGGLLPGTYRVCEGTMPGGWAQTYPTKAITIVVPTAAGGGNDAMARTIAQKLGPLLGQTIIVDGGLVVGTDW